MEELLAKHSTIMDRYDPQKRIGLMTDEWGIWTEDELSSQRPISQYLNKVRKFSPTNYPKTILL
jgi:alpha-N-arabinofuranosidase